METLNIAACNVVVCLSGLQHMHECGMQCYFDVSPENCLCISDSFLEYRQEQADFALKIKHPRRYSEAYIWLKNLKSTVRLSVAMEGALLCISSECW